MAGVSRERHARERLDCFRLLAVLQDCRAGEHVTCEPSSERARETREGEDVTDSPTRQSWGRGTVGSLKNMALLRASSLTFLSITYHTRLRKILFSNPLHAVMKSDSLQRFSEYLQKLRVTVPHTHSSVIITQCACLFRLLKICHFFNFKIITDEDMRHIEPSTSNKNISIVIYFKSWLTFGKSHLFHFTKSVVFPCRNFSFNSFTLRSALKVQCTQ